MVPNVAGSSPVIRPIIKRPNRGVFLFWAVRTRTAGSERQLARTSIGEVQALRSERGPWRETTMGIYSPVIRPIIKRPCWGRFLLKILVVCGIIPGFSGRHLVVFFIARNRGCFLFNKRSFDDQYLGWCHME